jgi:hypothetical protein
VEIHRPHSPVQSWRAFAVEIATIVVGVLIALSFEGAREWVHNRSLAREARETIARELTENQKGVNGDLLAMQKRRKDLDTALQFSDDLLASRPLSMHAVNLRFGFADLGTSAWQTADRTGALALMPYAEAQKYAQAYSLQARYQFAQSRTVEHVTTAMAMLSNGHDPTKAPHADVERFRAQVQLLMGDITLEEQLARQLGERYAETLRKD